MTHNLSSNIKKGRNLKWLVPVVIIIALTIGVFLGSKYKGNMLTYIFPEEFISKSVSGVKDETLSSQANIELQFIIPKGLKFDGITKTIEDQTLYISLLGTPTYTNKDSVENITIPLSDLSEKELKMIENIYLVDGRFGELSV